MEFHTAIADRLLHLALFVGAAVAIIAVALFMIERTLERDPKGTRSIRPLHVVVPIVVFVGIGIAERLYHALS